MSEEKKTEQEKFCPFRGECVSCKFFRQDQLHRGEFKSCLFEQLLVRLTQLVVK